MSDFALRGLWGVTYEPTTKERRDLLLSVGQQGQYERGDDDGMDVLLTVERGRYEANCNPNVVEVWLTPEQARTVSRLLLIRAATKAEGEANAAGALVRYLCARLAEDGDLFWLCGPGTEIARLLCAAAAELAGRPVEDVERELRQITPRQPRTRFAKGERP